MLRHLTLFLFLIGLSLSSVTAPVQAASDTPAVASCHDAMPAPTPHHKQDGDSGKTAKHLCIGCVADRSPTSESAAALPPAMTHHAHPLAALVGSDRQPTTPPPRS